MSIQTCKTSVYLQNTSVDILNIIWEISDPTLTAYATATLAAFPTVGPNGSKKKFTNSPCREEPCWQNACSDVITQDWSMAMTDSFVLWALLSAPQWKTKPYGTVEQQELLIYQLFVYHSKFSKETLLLCMMNRFNLSLYSHINIYQQHTH